MADFLSQEEIDALLNDKPEPASAAALNELENDTLGEIGNISMGSAATALSQILNKRVAITAPEINIMTGSELFASFKTPYVLVEVDFTSGLDGSNLFIIKVTDAVIIADLMMGGSGKDVSAELDEFKSSAVAEAMNQMIGSAATSMSTIFKRNVKISPPSLTAIGIDKSYDYVLPWPQDEVMVVVNFRMEIEDLIDSQIMQAMPIDTAKIEANMLLNIVSPGMEQQETVDPVPEETPEKVNNLHSEETVTPLAASSPPPPPSPSLPPSSPIDDNQTRNIDLILDVPLDVEVILGTAIRRIQEILSLTPGAIVELDRLVDESVDITVNGTPIAKGEVVVVNENFGVRITHILEPYERINQLRYSS